MVVLLNDDVKEYQNQLRKGQIQRAYKGIIAFMSGLKANLESRYPDYTASALYPGYMDMTYFAFTPPALRSLKLKVAIVFLHEECRFELWLAGNNRQIQAEYIQVLSRKDVGGLTLSRVQPGVDSILSSIVVEHPRFDQADELTSLIESKTIAFARETLALLS